MEQRAGADHVTLLGETDATLGHGAVEFFDGHEVAVDQRLVDEGPKMFGGLQLGTVGRLEHEPNAVRDGEVLGSMPAGVVELKHDALLAAGADRLGEIDEDRLEHLLADAVRDVPDRPPRCRFDEAGDVEPLEAMVTDRDRAFALASPYAARDRLQADAMLVRCPDLDRGGRMLAPLVRCRLLELFLSAPRSLSVAVPGWRGRGCWTEYSMAMSASQPR